MARSTPIRRDRRGAVVIDWLLVASVAFVALIAAAYIWMPDFHRAVGTLVDELSTRWGLD